MKIRRVLIYEGTEDWLKATFRQNWVKGLKTMGDCSVMQESIQVLDDDKTTEFLKCVGMEE